MGGGVSRLEETLWEEGKEEADNKNNDNDTNAEENRRGNKIKSEDQQKHQVVADGGLNPLSTTTPQTLDGSLPTACYQKLELQKTTVGQREYEIVDSATKEVLYKTVSVQGSLAWFDVLKPTVCGKPRPSDYLLRVRALDHLRRRWIVYRYHKPVFEGQRHHVDVDGASHKGLDESMRLYKAACITVSWSRYILVAAFYGEPEPEDWQLQTTNMEMEMEGDKVEVEDKDKSENNSHDGKTSPKHIIDIQKDDGNEFITPRELVQLKEKQLQQQQQRECIGGGIEESKIDETVTEEPCGDRNTNATDTFDTSLPQHRSSKPNKKRSARSLAQTKQLRSYFGDTLVPELQHKQNDNDNDKHESVTLKLKSRSSSLLRSGKDRLSASISSFRQQRKGDKLENKEEEQPTEKEAVQGHNNQATDDYIGGTALSNEATIVTSLDSSAPVDQQEGANNNHLQQLQQQNYEMALEGVLNLDGEQPIVQCQEISNKMMGNHQTFNTTKQALLTLLKLETKSRAQNQNNSNSNIDEATDYTPTSPESNEQPKKEADANPETARTELTEDTDNSSELDFRSGWNWFSSTAMAKMKESKADDRGNTTSSSNCDTTDRNTTVKSDIESDETSPGDSSLTVTAKPDETQKCKAFSPETPPAADSSPGDGIEEAKEEVGDQEDTTKKENSLGKNSSKSMHNGNKEISDSLGARGRDSSSSRSSTLDASILAPNESEEEEEENMPPLVSYFFWKHTSLNLGKHKIHMHLAQHSDLALHVVFAIVSNQVRSERNHAVLLATGIHPSWLYIDPRNPRATIS